MHAGAGDALRQQEVGRTEGATPGELQVLRRHVLVDLEPPRDEAQHVPLGDRVEALERGREVVVHPPQPQTRERGPQDLGVEGMRELYDGPPTLGAGRQQPEAVEPVDPVGADDPLEHVEGQGRSHRDDLERAPLVGREPLEAGLHQVTQTRRRERSVPRPQPGAHGERAGLEPGVDELAQQHRVALARGAQLAPGRAVDGTGERRRQQRLRLGSRERLHVDPGQPPVAHEAGDRIGELFAPPGRGDDGGPARGHGVVEHRRRHGVEEVGVVDAEHDVAVGRGAEDAGHSSQQPAGIGLGGVVEPGDQVGDRAQGHPRGAGRAGDPFGAGTAGVRRVDGGAGQARLAHTRLADEQDTAARDDGRAQQHELGVASHEWPRHGSSLSEHSDHATGH